MDLLTERVTRVEVIDSREWWKGRIHIAEWLIDVELSLQDDYRTLKFFISDKNND